MDDAVTSDRTEARGPSWSLADSISLVAVTTLAGILRFWQLGVPNRITFDEVYYAQDACVLVRGNAACDVEGVYSRVHPYLAKWIIGGGIELFGYRPFGWRFFAAVFGVAAIAMLYLLARRLLRSTAAATLAAGLLAFDGLHFVQSRLAMLDIFVATFALATILFVVIDRDRVRTSYERLRDRPWLVAAGAAAGGAAASKWSGVPFLLVAVVLVVVWDLRAARERGEGGGPVQVLSGSIGILAVSMVAVPLAVYVVATIGAFDARILALPWERGSWPRTFVGWQKHILSFGSTLEGEYPYTSPAWTWPLLKRPTIYALDVQGQEFRHILALGNPAIWWPSILAVGWCAVRWVRRRGGPEGVILAGLAAGYLWWIPVTSQRPFSFIFYMTPALPFLCLALARVAQLLWVRTVGRVVVGVGVAAVIALFAFFYPVLAFRPLDADAWTARLWFTDCRPEALEGDPPRPQGETTTPPPEGWCWI